MGVNTHAVTERLDKAGVKRRPLWRKDVTSEKVVELYKIHKNISKVAEILETNNGVISRRLKGAGVPVDYGYYKEDRRTDIPEKDVCKIYDSGKSVNHVARVYKANHGTIRKILVRNNREIRKRD